MLEQCMSVLTKQNAALVKCGQVRAFACFLH